jgi:3-hydroxymyristoyl/3-hydroxydecanoyl-(acyl carrier protein) dehydratase
MMEQWHRISLDRDPSGATVIRASAAGDSPWYSGHFPGNPILPGLAILAMVKEAILGEETVQGRRIQVLGIRRVRFRQPVKPDDTLALSFSRSRHEENLSYSFKVSLDEKPVCSGIIAASILSEADPEG